MSYSFFIFLAGAAAVAAILVWQFQWLDSSPDEFRLRRMQSLVSLVVIAVALGLLHYRIAWMEAPEPDPNLVLFGGPEEAPPPESPPPPPIPE